MRCLLKSLPKCSDLPLIYIIVVTADFKKLGKDNSVSSVQLQTIVTSHLFLFSFSYSAPAAAQVRHHKL